MDSFPEPATPKVTSRRDFLKISAKTLGLVGLGSMATEVWAGGASEPSGAHDKILVLIHLAGGNDGLNTLVPLQDERYLRLRPTLAIKAEQTLGLTEHYGFHPACRGLHDLYLNKQLAVIPQVSASSLSHFGASDTWNSGLQSPRPQATGWLGRFLDNTPNAYRKTPVAAHFSAQLPACLRSERDHRICSLNTTGADLPITHRGPSRGAVKRIGGNFPEAAFGQNLKTTAALIASGAPTRIYHLTLPGFDTHNHQAAAHAYLLRTLSDGIAAFDRSLQQTGMSDRVLTVAYSEFGRSLQENERLGTDHALAGPVFLVGNYSELNLPHMLHLQAHAMACDTPPTIGCHQVLSALASNWLNCPNIVPLS